MLTAARRPGALLAQPQPDPDAPSALHRHDVERASDLRRRHARRVVEQLVAAAAALPDPERILIQTAYADGRPVTEIAKLRGEDPRSLRRRIRTLVRRVLTPEFAYVALHRAAWPRTRRRVGELCVLEGRSLREAAEVLDVSLHAVRRHRDTIIALAEAGAGRARRAPAPGREAAPW